jgi:hypothetical protein
MSRAFGPIRQIAFVVRDIDAAMRQWTEVLGVGPFHVNAGSASTRSSIVASRRPRPPSPSRWRTPAQLPRIEGIRANAEGWDGTGGVIEAAR